MNIHERQTCWLNFNLTLVGIADEKQVERLWSNLCKLDSRADFWHPRGGGHNRLFFLEVDRPKTLPVSADSY